MNETPTELSEEEERLMQQIIISHHLRLEAESLEGAPSTDHAWQQLRFRLKREGLLKSQPDWRTWAPMALAAGLLVAVAVPLLMPASINVQYTAPSSMRGGALHFEVRDPLGQAKDLATQLKALDPAVKLHWFEGTATIDMQLQATQLDQAEAMLRAALNTPQVRLQPGFNRLTLAARP